MAGVTRAIFILVIIFVTNLATGQARIPAVLSDVKVELLFPKGIRVSVQHADGIEGVTFHIKFNEDFIGFETGAIAENAVHTQNGRWTYENRRITKLRLGEVVYYWVYAIYEGVSYKLPINKYEVIAIDNMGSNASLENDPCNDTPTRLVDRLTGQLERACAGELLLYEHFDSLNQNIWTRVEKFTGPPAYPFVVFRNDERNVKIVDGNLQITPTLTELEFGRDFVRQGNLTLSRCTAEPGTSACQQTARGAYILPPVLSGSIDTKDKFAFIFGKIEIRAKLPRGDWIYTILGLTPLNNIPLPNWDPPQINVAASTGNARLKLNSGSDISGHLLYGGAVNMLNPRTFSPNFLMMKYSANLWSDDYHIYEVEWGTDAITCKVDGIEYGVQRTNMPTYWPPKYLSVLFVLFGLIFDDLQYYIELTLAVGGHSTFSDFSISDSYAKPWRNPSPKALFDFFNATDLWSRTWIENSTDLKVDYNKVWAL